jgi:ribosomal protein S18 acetylase RimI-like enzyme
MKIEIDERKIGTRMNADERGFEIRKANSKDVSQSLGIARDLKEWFTNDALKNMEKDFRKDLIVAFIERVAGFLNYEVGKDFLKILWIGVDRDFRRKGIGESLLERLEEIAGENCIKKIVVDTLTYEDDYEPYVSTRNFYLKNGFVYGKILEKKEGEDEMVEMEKVL